MHPNNQSQAIPVWRPVSSASEDDLSDLFYVITQGPNGVEFINTPIFLDNTLDLSSPTTFIRRAPHGNPEQQYHPYLYTVADINIGQDSPWLDITVFICSMREGLPGLFYIRPSPANSTDEPSPAEWKRRRELIAFRQDFPRAKLRLAPTYACAGLPYHPALYGE